MANFFGPPRAVMPRRSLFWLRRPAGAVGIAAALLLFSTNARAARDLHGTVRDARTLLPIPYASVELTETGAVTEADANGRFVFTALPNNDYHLCVRRIGYAPRCHVAVRLSAEESATPVVLLAPQPILQDPLVVTAPRGSSPAGTHRVVTAREIVRSGARSAADALEQAPEVELLREGTSSARVSIRGSRPEAVRVVVDGITLNADGGAVDLAGIPAAEIERIEVVSGPAVTAAGPDALGGAILITTRAAAATPDFALGAGYGSFDERVTSLETDGLGWGPHRVRVGWRNELQDGDFLYYDTLAEQETRRLNNEVHRQNFSARGGGPLGAEARWQVSAAYYRVRAGVPGLLFALTPDAWRRQQRLTTAGSAEYGGFTGGVSYTRDWNYHINTGALPYETESTSETTRGHLDYVRSRGMLRGAALAAEYIYEHQGGTDHRNPGYSFGTAARSNYAATVRYRRDWVVRRTTLQRAEINAAYRYDQTETEAEYPVSVISPAIDPPQRVWRFESPQVNAALHGAWSRMNWSVQAGYARAFRRPPLFDQFWDESYRTRGNPGLRPERSEQREIGYALKPPGPVDVDFQQRFYRTNYSDLIVWRLGQGQVWTPANIGRAEIDGREEFVQASIMDGTMEIRIAHLYQNHRNTAGEPNTDGQPLPFQYRHKTTAGFSATWTWGWIDLAHRRYDRRYLREVGAASKSLEPYAVTDITAGVRTALAGLHTEIRLTVANLANEPYEVLERQPMPGRSYHVAIQFSTDRSSRR